MLIGRGVAGTGELRGSDGRGRHTTTGRTLYRLSSGALVIDTPGVRSVGIASGEAAAQDAFEDIAALAAGCRFSDCTHRSEPGCLVREAMLAEELEQDSYLNFLRLREEAGSREEELRLRREKQKQFGKMRYRMRKEDRRGGR
jgi:ribosome biogenesis GTPase